MILAKTLRTALVAAPVLPGPPPVFPPKLPNVRLCYPPAVAAVARALPLWPTPGLFKETGTLPE